MSIKGSITALVTPMNEKGNLDYDSLEKLINYQKLINYHASVSLSDSDRLQARIQLWLAVFC